MNRIFIVCLVVLLSFPLLLFSLPIFIAKDHPSDNGTAVDLFWQYPDTQVPASSEHVSDTEISYVIIEKQDSEQVWVKIAEFSAGENFYTDAEDNEPDKLAKYRLTMIYPVSGDSLFLYAETIPRAQWFDYRKLPLLLMILMLSSAVIFYIASARKGKELFIRKINGLESMDEAVGRATEKGKPILFVPGIGDLDDIQTIAGLTILSQLAFKAATYNAELIVPVSKSMVLSTAREIVKEAYLKAGRHDAFKKDNIFYLTDDQFGYVAGIDGIMLREQPAANFFLGTFYAESLILAETGFGTGAMQTAGTAQPHQLPFFVVTCDYTLIGEELFAASAYLSKEPNQLGSLKGQDFGKLVIVLMIIIGSILEMAGYHWFKNILMMD